MKNLNKLKTGEKPSPNQLVIVQGFVNTLDIENKVDMIGTKEKLKKWLVFHGLLNPHDRVSSNDFITVISLRKALRSLLLSNNNQRIKSSDLEQLNKMFSRFTLVVECKMDGTLILVPSRRGMAGVIGFMLATIINAVNDGTWYNLKACNNLNCQWAFYDSSKNHSGRWCEMSLCGSREKARSYRRRQSKN